jgi:hypothetical protein
MHYRGILLGALLVFAMACGQAGAVENPDAFLQCCADFMKRHGHDTYLEAYYNLFSITDEFRVTGDNIALIRCLGPEMARVEPGKTYRKEHFPAMRANLESFNAKLSAFFQIPDNAPGLSQEQRDFLSWHFASDKEYKTNFLDSRKNVHVVGWDMSDTVIGEGEYTLITYGLLRCIALIAVSSDGSAYFSHNSGILPTQTFKEIEAFVKSHPNPVIFSMGVNPAAMAGLLRNDMQLDIPIYLASKDSANGSIWSVRLTRTPESFSLSVNSRDLPMVGPHMSRFLESLKTKPYNYGRTADIFPGTDYAPVPFVSLEDLYKGHAPADVFPQGYLGLAPAR